MDCASVITYAGELKLFSDLETLLVQTIPKESTEWKRPFGRAIKSVQLNASFVPFSKDCTKSANQKLIAQPILHTYWTDCNDIEAYKNSVKNDIEHWMKQIAGADWMIILVEVYDIRRSNKLIPRTTVLDKIRADFAGRQTDRVVSLINPIKSESKSAESLRGLVNRIRVQILASYNKTLSSFEEAIRTNRECRPQPNWSYCAYFTMQEEMALVLEMLGLYEEALVQYDELDALFTQFVLNSTKGESPKWLASFTVPLQKWAGPTIGQRVTPGQRDLLRCSKLDLLQFRSYLFGRQCSLLLQMSKPHEVAQRTMSFLHSCVQELKILEVSAPTGAQATWGYLVCLEILKSCEKFNDSEHVEAYSVHTAGLWAYAKDMLKTLGGICGLTSKNGPTSQQLHAVVELASGMGDPPTPTTGTNPVERLKEALSSKESYYRNFLELSELAISTYKHIGRMRFARLMGMELAKMYLDLGEPDKAATFLSAAAQGAQDDKWTELAAKIQLQLAKCYSESTPDIKYTLCCVALAASNSEESIRLDYYQKFLKSMKLFAQETPMPVCMGDWGIINKVEIDSRHQIRRGECTVSAKLEFHSLLPGPLHCDSVSISIDKGTTEPTQRARIEPKQEVFRKLPMMELVDHKQDGSLNGANIVCHEPQKALKRTDSQGRGRKISNPLRRDFTLCLKNANCVIYPGNNSIELLWTAQNTGRYLLNQLSVALPGLEFLDTVNTPTSEIFVEEVKSEVEAKVQETQLLAGIPQHLDLVLRTGSFFIIQDTPLSISCTPGLKIGNEIDGFHSSMEISLPEIEPFESFLQSKMVLAELPEESDGEAIIQHKITISCGWCGSESTVNLSFLSPLRSTMRLHSAAERKFLQVTMSGLTSQRLLLRNPILSSDAIALISENSDTIQPLMIAANLKSSFLWELDLSTFQDITDNLRFTFSVEYSPEKTDEPVYYTYKCHFQINSFKTLYAVKCAMDAGKDSEFCRVGAICQLTVRISKVGDRIAGGTSVMYEVCADQSLWAICGRQAGVLQFHKEIEQSVILELIPQTQGYLPLPQIRLSRYIPAEKDTGRGDDKPRLESFSTGEVYCSTKSEQIHILPAGSVD